MAGPVKGTAATGSPLAEINMIPLIDVMLVLLVIFIVTAPLLTHAVRIDLPRVTSEPVGKKPEVIALAVDAGGAMYWNGEALEPGALAERFAAAARRSPQPELHLSIDRAVRYEIVADTMATASKAGLTRIGFVSDPREERPAQR